MATGLETRDRLIMAGLFGGCIEAVRDVRCTFENTLRITLEEGRMDSEESIFNVLSAKFPFLYPLTIFGYPHQLY